MTQALVAVLAGVFLLTPAVSSLGQTTDERRETSFAPHSMQSPAQAETGPVIVVRPDLSDEKMADLYMVRKEYREAAAVYKKLSDQEPRNPVYLNKLGIALHQQTALSSALKYYERAIKADPLYADAENNIGTIWYQRKKYGKAIKAYQKAIAIRSDMAVLFSNLGYAYFADKKYEEAIASFRQALSIDPQLFEHGTSRTGSLLQDRSVSDRGRFYFLLAKSFAQAGNADRCLLYLRKAKEEGYKSLSDVKTDPAFSAVLKLPAIEEILAPKPADSSQP
jgi:tetratricopeptide (TPR) repeat protein